MFADGFGIHAKLIGDLLPDPKTGQLTAEFEGPAAAPVRRVRHPPLRLRPRRPRDPDPLRHLHRRDRISTPGTTCCPTRRSELRSSASTPAPADAACPGELRPFDPRLVAGTSNPAAGAFSAFTLKLDRDDGDQFLGDLNFTMPPGLTADPARGHLLP